MVKSVADILNEPANYPCVMAVSKAEKLKSNHLRPTFPALGILRVIQAADLHLPTMV